MEGPLSLIDKSTNSAPTSLWGRFLNFLANRKTLLFRKVGLRLATAGALLAIPVIGWVIALFQLGFSVLTAYEIYAAWKEFNDEEDKEAKGSPTQVIGEKSFNEKLNSYNTPGTTATPTQTSATVPGTQNNRNGVLPSTPYGGYKENRGTHIHAGFDEPGIQGTPIYAVDDGDVVRADGKDEDGYGNQILIKHGDGTKTRYAHLSEMNVRSNDKVKKGQLIGKMGGKKGSPGSGRSTGSHLHYERIDASGNALNNNPETLKNEVKLALNPSSTPSTSTAIAAKSPTALPPKFGESQRTTAARLAQANIDAKKSGDVIIANNNNNNNSSQPAPAQQTASAGAPSPYDRSLVDIVFKDWAI
jgi:hypothetical protein